MPQTHDLQRLLRQEAGGSKDDTLQRTARKGVDGHNTVKFTLSKKAGITDFTEFLSKEMVARASIKQEEPSTVYVRWRPGWEVEAKISTEPNGGYELLAIMGRGCGASKPYPHHVLKLYTIPLRNDEKIDLFDLQCDVARVMRDLVKQVNILDGTRFPSWSQHAI